MSLALPSATCINIIRKIIFIRWWILLEGLIPRVLTVRTSERTFPQISPSRILWALSKIFEPKKLRMQEFSRKKIMQDLAFLRSHLRHRCSTRCFCFQHIAQIMILDDFWSQNQPFSGVNGPAIPGRSIFLTKFALFWPKNTLNGPLFGPQDPEQGRPGPIFGQKWPIFLKIHYFSTFLSWLIFSFCRSVSSIHISENLFFVISMQFFFCLCNFLQIFKLQFGIFCTKWIFW